MDQWPLCFAEGWAAHCLAVVAECVVCDGEVRLVLLIESLCSSSLRLVKLAAPSLELFLRCHGAFFVGFDVNF